MQPLQPLQPLKKVVPKCVIVISDIFKHHHSNKSNNLFTWS
jgi:hypothetical protein